MFFCCVGLSLCIRILQDGSVSRMLPPLVAAFRFGFKFFIVFREQLDSRNDSVRVQVYSRATIKPLVRLAGQQLTYYWL